MPLHVEKEPVRVEVRLKAVSLPALALEDLAEPSSGLDRVIDPRRIREDGLYVDAVGEYPPLAIDDLAALGVCRDRPRALPLSTFDQHVVLEQLPLDETGFNRDAPKGHDARGDQQTALYDVAPAIGKRDSPCHRRLERPRAGPRRAVPPLSDPEAPLEQSAR